MPQDPDMPGLRNRHPGPRRDGASGFARGPQAAGGVTETDLVSRLPARLPPLVTAPKTRVAGQRGPSLAEELGIDDGAAAEILLLLETLSAAGC